MEIKTKFDIGQEVFCLIGYQDNKIHKTKIEAVFTNFFKDEEYNFISYRIVDEYDYVHKIPEEQIFATKEEAEQKLADLVEKVEE